MVVDGNLVLLVLRVMVVDGNGCCFLSVSACFDV